MKGSLLPALWRRKTTSPWQALEQMERDMERFLGSTDYSLVPQNGEVAEFVPSCEIVESENEFVAKFDVPGIKKEDVKVEVDDHRLMVSGERKFEKKEKDTRHYFSESSYGSFWRTISLPADIDSEGIEAQYANGVLTVSLPKIKSAKAKRVAVQ